MSGYARPATLSEALELLAEPGAIPLGGGTDVAGQVDRAISRPALLVDLQAAGLDEIRANGEGLFVGAGVTLAELAESPLIGPYRAVESAARVAASPLLRNVGTVGGNLCQHTRCWYYRGLEWHCWLDGGDDLARGERTSTVAPDAASAGARSVGWAEMQSPGSRPCFRWSPICA